MRSRSGIWIFIVIIILLDIYVFQAVKAVSSGASPKWRMLVYSLYWVLSAGALLVLILLPYVNYENWPKSMRTYLFAIIIGLFMAKMLAAAFFVLDDFRRVFQWVVNKLFARNVEEGNGSGEAISRSVFMSWLGLGIGSGLFGTLLYGFRNKYRYKLERVQLAYENLPAAFKGLKIVHISDIHSGSFLDKKAVEHGIDMILSEKPDLILFTGDLVNDKATEMKEYMDVFSRLKAPMGVFSTLGNHDYGDYVRWASEADKKANLDSLKAIHGELGWRLLLNENVSIEKEGSSIGLIGVENVSAKARFHSYGHLPTAYNGAEKQPFKILMSHDPSHWDGEVRKSFPDIDLTLSGHTHGMQFGVEIPGFRWSPVQWVYKQWAGLYEEGKQKLYINRGFGFIGYPGRVGILPEITVIELG